MKKYIICFLLCACVLYAGYYITFRGLGQSRNENTEDSSQKDIEVISNDDIIKASTKLIVESYNVKDGTSEKEIITMPAMYLGLTRNGLIEQLDEYMNNLSIKDLEDGLISFNLLYYSQDYIMLRKTFNLSDDYHKYFVKLNRGQITVYYSDKKTVYEYTDIDINQLPESLQIEIINGKEIKDEKELYDFLENYST